MSMAAQECLLVVIAASLDDGGRKAAIAFGVALAAVSSGTTVFVFLSLEAAVLAAPSGATDLRPRGFSESLADYVTHFTDLGGQLEVCSSCFEEYCRDLPKDASGRVALRPGTTIHGLGIVANALRSCRPSRFECHGPVPTPPCHRNHDRAVEQRTANPPTAD